MLMPEIIIALVSSLLGGGLATAITTYVLKSRELKSNDFTKLIELLQVDNKRLSVQAERLQKDEDENRKRINELEKEVHSLRNKLMIMESLHLDLPLPQWVKSKDGIMLSFNNLYTQEFITPNGKREEQYIGHSDVDFWGEKIGNEYWENDREVIRLKRPIHVVETVQTLTGSKLWEVYKYPIYSNRTIIGVGGIAYRPTAKKPEIIAEAEQ